TVGRRWLKRGARAAATERGFPTAQGSVAYGCTFRPDQVHNFPLRGPPPSPVTRAPLSPRVRGPESRGPTYFGVSVTVAFSMTTFSRGRSCAPVGTLPMARTVAMDSASAVWPKTVYWLSSERCRSRQMKNCDPAELGSLVRAIDSVPGSCGVLLNSA